MLASPAGRGLKMQLNQFGATEPPRGALFPVSVLFALFGHLVLAFALEALALVGVDFSGVDPEIILAAQLLLLAIQFALIAAALAKTGVTAAKTLVGGGAFLFATAVFMLTFVALQCDLFGACL